MAQLTPIELEDGTVIYIEATENATSSTSVVAPNSPGEISEPKRGLVIGEPPKQATQNFRAIEGTIRAYTTYTLNAFRNFALAEVNEVTLKFGISVELITGLPYIAKGTANSNVEITVKCTFPKIAASSNSSAKED